MNTFIAFLRGVNIGGHKAVKMDVLKKALLTIGFDQVNTYLNSGNLILRSAEPREAVRKLLLQTIQAEFGFTIEVIVKTAVELTAVFDENPFDPVSENDFSKRAVIFLSGHVGPDLADIFRKEGKINESCKFAGDVLFVYYHNGFSRTKFTGDYIERKLRLTATARNWNTIRKLAEMVNS